MFSDKAKRIVCIVLAALMGLSVFSAVLGIIF